jgi:multiple sugar transport system permease protein
MLKPHVKRRIKESLKAYCFLAPNLIGFLAFTLIPVVASAILSFTNWDILTPLNQITFTGFRNYFQLLGFKTYSSNPVDILSGVLQIMGHYLVVNDPLFWKYLWNTVYLMGGIPFSMVGSLILALALNQKIRGIVFFRTLYFLPSISAGVALFMLWRWVYNPDYGLLNSLLHRIFGMNGPAWLGDPVWVKPAFIFMGIWIGVGGINMILYLAGLQNIPSEYYEAAEIDGASAWQKFKAITWPMLTPTTFFIFTMSLIAGFQGGFDAIYIMTGGGPAGESTTMGYYIYQTAFQNYRMGYAAAEAWVLFLIVFIVTLLNWKYGGQRVHYF